MSLKIYAKSNGQLSRIFGRSELDNSYWSKCRARGLCKRDPKAKGYDVHETHLWIEENLKSNNYPSWTEVVSRCAEEGILPAGYEIPQEVAEADALEVGEVPERDVATAPIELLTHEQLRRRKLIEQVRESKGKADAAERRNREADGELVELELIKTRDIERIASVTQGLESLPKRVGALGAGLTAIEIEEIASEEVRKIRLRFAEMSEN